jgi:hypothetical protein
MFKTVQNIEFIINILFFYVKKHVGIQTRGPWFYTLWGSGVQNRNVLNMV